MRYKIHVIAPKDSPVTLFFFCDGVTFDILFAQVLAWENDQFLTVSKTNGTEETIRFFDLYGAVPEWKFDHGGSIVDCLYAFQFSAGDIISFAVRDTGWIGGDLASRLTDSYMRHYVATHIYERDEYDNFPPQKKHAFTEALRLDAREQIKKNDQWLIFRELQEREWK